MLARVHAPVLTTKPLSVHELRSGQVNRGSAAVVESLDRLAVEGLGQVAVAQKGGRPGANAERPTGAAGACSLVEVAQRLGRDCAGVASGACLDQLEACPVEDTEMLVRARALSGGEGMLVAAETVVQDGFRVFREDSRPSGIIGGRLLEPSPRSAPTPCLLASPSGKQQRGEKGWGVGGRVVDRLRLFDQR